MLIKTIYEASTIVLVKTPSQNINFEANNQLQKSRFSPKNIEMLASFFTPHNTHTNIILSLIGSLDQYLLTGF